MTCDCVPMRMHSSNDASLRRDQPEPLSAYRPSHMAGLPSLMPSRIGPFSLAAERTSTARCGSSNDWSIDCQERSCSVWRKCCMTIRQEKHWTTALRHGPFHNRALQLRIMQLNGAPPRPPLDHYLKPS